MAPYDKNITPPSDREASTAGLIEEERASRESECRDLGLNRRSATDENTGQEHKLSRIVSGIDQEDATEAYRLDEEDNKAPSLPNSSTSSVNTPPPKKIISWEDEDPENPYNWSSVRYNPLLNF